MPGHIGELIVEVGSTPAPKAVIACEEEPVKNHHFKMIHLIVVVALLLAALVMLILK